MIQGFAGEAHTAPAGVFFDICREVIEPAPSAVQHRVDSDNSLDEMALPGEIERDSDRGQAGNAANEDGVAWFDEG